MKLVEERYMKSIVTKIINNQFKNYKILPSNNSLYRIIIKKIIHENNGKIYYALYDNYKDIILKYISDNFKEYKK